MTRKPPDDTNLVHLHATPTADLHRPIREVTTERPEPKHTIRPRVAFDTAGAPIAQMTYAGVEWVIDHTEHADDGEQLTVTLRGPLRALEHGDRAEQAARMAGEVVRRVRGKRI